MTRSQAIDTTPRRRAAPHFGRTEDAFDAPLASRRPDTRTRPDQAMSDWPDLMAAVTARVRRLAGALAAADAASARAGIGEDLLDCAAALQQLQGSTVHELARCRHLQAQDLEGLHAALARSHADGLRASHLARHDGLTALPNRRLFGERLEQALRDGPRPAVLFLDLDGFKAINDGHGHAVGDELLRLVAARLARGMRAGDLVARWGGDEFACLLAGPMASAPLALLARKLIAAVAEPLQIGTLRLSVRASVGIACAPGDGHDAVTLMAHADAAMYRAKRGACGHAFHAP